MENIVKFSVNGNEVSVLARAENTLLEVLRDKLDLTGTKCGCNRGDCGACTVILDGAAVKSCLVLANTLNGRKVVTIEGIARGKDLHPIQRAFHELGAPQCGFCSPGMVMAAVAFLDKNPKPTMDEIKEAMSGNLCRCGGYQKYADAILAVSKGEFASKGGK
jgi:aerobic-type carbon monoxide dehydrogenase small subunit (CoxS/CutS family)